MRIDVDKKFHSIISFIALLVKFQKDTHTPTESTNDTPKVNTCQRKMMIPILAPSSILLLGFIAPNYGRRMIAHSCSSCS
jgi:hypothetical protein